MIILQKGKTLSTHNPLLLMKKVRYLRIVFTPEISHAEIQQFRGAVAQTVGFENTLFHNHQGDGFRYAYPLIQYKRFGGKAAMVCLDEGADAIHNLFQRSGHTLRIGSREITLDIENLQLREHLLQVWDHSFPYRIHNWLALNEEHYADYQAKTDTADRRRFLESILRGNILSMAKGLGWHVAQRIELHLTQLSQPHHIADYKTTQLSAFHAQFLCNVSLPNGIGLGKGAAKGFGVVSGIRKNEKE